MTQDSIENAALYYLQRFSSSSENFRKVMMRRVARSAKFHNTSLEKGAEIVDQLISRFIEVGLLDDLHFAKVQVVSFRRRGLSERVMRSRLLKKGLSIEVVNESLAHIECDLENPELIAAIIFSRKRRLGLFREPADKLNRSLKKDLAKLARAGFSYHTAKQVIGAETKQELEEMVENNDFGQY